MGGRGYESFGNTIALHTSGAAGTTDGHKRGNKRCKTCMNNSEKQPHLVRGMGLLQATAANMLEMIHHHPNYSGGNGRAAGDDRLGLGSHYRCL
jgi:hypothetical protein